MLNSDDGNQNFVAGLCIGAALVLSAIAAFNAAIDPFDNSRPGRSADCWSSADDAIIPRLSSIQKPEEILVGTSRVKFGFERDLFSKHLRVSNLGLSGSKMAEIDELTRIAIMEAPVQIIWLGIDFYSFLPAGGRTGSLYTAAPDWFIRFLSVEATIWSINTILCRCVSHETRYRADENILRDHFKNQNELKASDLREAIQSELQHLRSILELARSRNIQVLAFTGPYSKKYMHQLIEAGLEDIFFNWRRAVADILSDYKNVISEDFISPNSTLSFEGYFFDLAHFDRKAGRQIVKSLKSKLSGE